MVAEPEAIGAAAVNADAEDDAALDAYSLAVSTAAERLIPSVASLRVAVEWRLGRRSRFGGRRSRRTGTS